MVLFLKRRTAHYFNTILVVRESDLSETVVRKREKITRLRNLYCRSFFSDFSRP